MWILAETWSNLGEKGALQTLLVNKHFLRERGEEK